MIIKKFKINKSLNFGVIIIISFVFTINIQPAVFGGITNFFQIDYNNNIINDMPPRLYEEISSFNKNFPNLTNNTNTLPDIILKINKEIIYEFFTYINNENAGFVLQFSYFYNLLENKR